MRRIKRLTAKTLLSFWVLSGLLPAQYVYAKYTNKKSKATLNKQEKKARKSKAIPYIDHQSVGMASWYGPGFHGRKTASGERFDMHDMTAAHKTLPLGSLLKVTNLRNNKTVIVKVNDRGPYARGRILDLSKAAALQLGFLGQGHTRVAIETLSSRDFPIQDAPSNSDDVLLASNNPEQLLTPDASLVVADTPVSVVAPETAPTVLALNVTSPEVVPAAPSPLDLGAPSSPPVPEKAVSKSPDLLNRVGDNPIDNPAYVLHLAAFPSVDYAQDFVKDIRARLNPEQNKQVFIQKDGQWFVVALGPFKEASSANAAREALFAQLNMQPLLKLAPPAQS